VGQFDRKRGAISTTTLHGDLVLTDCPIRCSGANCSLIADAAAASVADVEYLHDVAFDREQHSVDMGPTAVKKLAYFNR
jgi:hypothetical protein